MEERHPGGQDDVQPSIFDSADELTEHERELYRTGIRKARNTLFAAGGIMFVVDMVMLLIQRESFATSYLLMLIGFDALVLAIFIGLGFWTRRKPHTAILTGLILFCALQIFAMIADPSNIYKGIIVKVVVVVSLVSGLKKARALQQLDKFAGGRYE